MPDPIVSYCVAGKGGNEEKLFVLTFFRFFFLKLTRNALLLPANTFEMTKCHFSEKYLINSITNLKQLNV